MVPPNQQQQKATPGANPVANAVAGKDNKSKFAQRIKSTIAGSMGNPTKTKSALQTLAKTAANDPGVTPDDINLIATALQGVK